MEFLLHRAGGGDPGHAGDALQLGHQGVIQKFRQLHGGHALHGHGGYLHRKHGGVDFQHIGRANHLIPVCRKGGELLLDVHADGIHVHRFLKFQQDHAVIFIGGGGDLLDMLQCGHSLLHGLGDLRLHLFGAGAGIDGGDHNVGEVHIGQQVGGHPQIGHHPQHQHGDHRHEHGQGFFYTEFRH